MQKKSSKFFVALCVSLLANVALLAEEPAKSGASAGEAPWLKGVEISPIPVDISPVIPLKISGEDGQPLPATMTEDVSFTVMCESTIFDDAPPTEYKGQQIPNPKWESNPSPSWYFIDWEKNKNNLASTTIDVALNQMVVTPLNPTGKGAVTCYIGRKLRYYLPEPGKTKVTFANSSGAKDVRVLDITPPTCGLEITVKEGKSGSFWAVENPPDKYPLPKMADVCMNGGLVNEDPEEVTVVPGLELGANMVVQQGSIKLPANAEISFKVIGGDNYKLNTAKVKYGICNGAGGEPAPVGPVNPTELKLADLQIPENAHFYIDASDEAGNRQVLFVPIEIK
ncbi:MAG: hypothetical protein ACOYXC_06420 [Candidatus Rifleibacteriota bacterium]